jgi:hypothetical protein
VARFRVGPTADRLVPVLTSEMNEEGELGDA